MAIDDFVIRSVQNDSLDAVRDAQEARAEAANNLATGRRVTRVIDDPSDYYRAQALSDRLSELDGALDTIDVQQTSSAVSIDTLIYAEDFARQLSSLAYAARTTELQDLREDYAAQFNEVRRQIDLLAQDADDFLGDSFSALELGIGDAELDYNNFETDLDIRAALNGVDTAIDRLRTRQSEYGSDLAILSAQESYTTDLSNTVELSRDRLVQVDLNEEAAIQIAAQVRSDLALQGDRILAQGDSLLLGLFQ